MFKHKKGDRRETEFLPSALEIIETPASPGGRIVIWVLGLILFSAFLWAYLGRVDEVAVARGKVVPAGRLKIVQPLVEGMITAIHVQEGERIEKGDLLVELDASLEEVNVKAVEQSLEIARLEKSILETERVDSLDKKPNWISDEHVQKQQELLIAREEEYEAQLQVMDATIAQKQTEISIAQQDLERVKKELDDSTEKERAVMFDYQNANAPKEDWDEAKNNLYITEKAYNTASSRLQRALNALEEVQSNQQAFKRKANTWKLSEIVELDKKIQDLEATLEKATRHVEFQQLTSPTSGIIQSIAMNTLGGVVTPAQALMTIVPEGTPLIVEAQVLNKDVGFVQVGQDVEIKLDTFSFQKYGTISGKIKELSPDAIDDEHLGPVYRIKVELGETKMMVDGQPVLLAPGMLVSAEIKTRDRRIIEFFLEPIIKYADESLTLR